MKRNKSNRQPANQKEEEEHDERYTFNCNQSVQSAKHGILLRKRNVHICHGQC